MKSDAAVVFLIFLAVMLATLAARGGLFKRTVANLTSEIQSTGDPLLDEIYRDYPDLDPRR